MLNKLKKIISIITALAITITALPINAFGLNEESGAVYEEQSGQSAVTDETADAAGTEKTEETEAYVLSEIESKREANTKYYRMSNGSITAAVYPYDVHYADENGEYQDIDNSLVDGEDEGDNVYTNKSNSTLVKFMKKSNANKLYTINQNGYKIKVSVKNAEKVSATVSEYAEIGADSPYRLDNITGRVTYYGILPNTDIEYTYTSTKLKENIIINKETDLDSLVYEYHINNSLDVVQDNEQSISVYEKGTQNLIFRITAPTMWDSAGNYCDNLTVTLTETKNSKFTVRLDWTMPEESVYPVTVDPVLNFTASGDSIQDTHITTYGPAVNYDNNNHIRISNNAYALVQYPLPSLQSGDKIINAQLVLTPYCMHPDAESAYSMVNSYNPSVNISAHKINRSWLEETATYQNIAPENGFYDSTVIDYRVVNGDSELYTWDVTRLANEWADGYSVNNGILLKYESPAPEDSFDAFFLATNGIYVPTYMYPAIIYQYINTTGIEDYLSYHTYDAGYAGTVYTNDLTGNVTVVNPIVQTGGNIMPITVSMVYNLDNADYEVPYGRCWSMNWSQRLDKSPDYNFNGTEHVRYRDGDGTEHYFKYDSSSGLYKDEIDPDRTLSYNSGNGIFTMTDSSGTTMQFTKNGSYDEWYLTKVTDPYGNYIDVILDPLNYTHVTKLQSSTGNVVNFVYDSSYGFIRQVKYYDGNTEKTIHVGYNNYSYPHNNCIGRITYADGTSVNYRYHDYTSCLSRIDDIDGYHIDFGYTNGSPKRVNSVREYSTDGVLGYSVEMKYETTATYFDDKTNGRKYLYTFAKNGTLKSAVDVTANDGNGYGQYYEYNKGNTEVLKGTNNLTFVSKTQKSTVNILTNHSFESESSLPSFQVWDESVGTSSGGVSTEKNYIGNRSYKIYRDPQSNSSRALGFYSVYLYGGKTYTFSAYVNTKDMVSSGKGASLFITSPYYSEESEHITESADEWNRIHITFTPVNTGYVSVCMTLIEAAGSVYFDCIQLEEGGLSEYNMLENAGFEQDSYRWDIFSEYGSITEAEKIGGQKSVKSVGGAHKFVHYQQNTGVPNGKSGDTYVASAFAKADSISKTGWQFALLVRFTKNGGTVNECTLLFNSYTTEWQKVAGIAKATGDYDNIQFWLLYYNNCNTVYFDNAQLIKDTFGNTYTYDDNGNLTSTVDLQGKDENTFQYDGNNQLISQTNVGGGKIFYAYDLHKKQQLEHVSSGGVTTTFTYDNYGNATKTSTQGNKLIEGKYYYIRNVHYGKYLDVVWYGTTNGTSINYQVYSENTAQRWKLIKNTDGTYSFMPECAPGMLLSVEPSTLYNNARVALYADGAVVYQKFNMLQLDGNIYRIDVANSAYSLDGDVNGCYAYSTHGQDYQQFVIIPVEESASEENPEITSSATYTSNGEYMTSITDSRGETTNYTYNESRGYVTSETNPKNVTTNYTYNGSELLTGVSIANGSQNSSVSYTYDNGKKLSSILSPSGTTYSFLYDGFGRTTATKVGNRTLSTYTYNSKGLTSSMNYGNGVTVSYGYDALNRQTEFYVNGTARYNYRYDGMSRLSELTDLLLGKTTRYEYDILGRLTGEKLINNTNGTILSKLSLRYDDSKNRLAGYDVMVGGTTNSTDYVYGGNTVAPDLITGVNRNGTQKISYTYDGLNRLSVRNLNNYFTEYTYLQGANANSTTTLVSSMKNGNDTLAYTYDELGNITSISKNGTLIESYTYDNLNQLKTVTRGTDTYTYNYDNGGNILSVTKNGQSVKSYTYGDSEWKDLLTAYNGQTITYDNIGNPLTYYNGSTFTWSDGRKLTGVTKGTDNISYAYDSNGLRATKNVNGTVTEYYWLDGTLYAEKTGNQYIYFHYDDNGIAYGFTVEDGSTSTDYYYIHNLQGDVIGIVDNNGTKVVEYTYDEWGKILSQTNSTIANINPFRYRGYYYDTETGFYYCRSRYYDPEISRWINADGQMAGVGGEILGYNQFIYCFNNPVNLYDDMGTWPKWNTLVKGALLLTIGVLAVSAVVVAPVTCSMVVALGYAAVATAGTVTAAMGASEVYESFTDENPIRNAIGDTAYDLVKSASLTVISAGPAVIEAGTSPQSTSLCFVAGTLVLTDDGQVSIEKIQIGDYVWASTPETGETSLKKVVQTFVNETDELIYVITNNECIITTPGHPFYVSNKGWVNAEDLKCYDLLIDNFGNTIEIIETRYVVVLNPIKVYNFEVEDYHTYFVSKDAILVHNTGCNLGKLSNSYLKRKLKIDAHEVKIEYLGKKAQISLYDLAADKNTGIIYIVDKAGKIVAETIYKTK